MAAKGNNTPFFLPPGRVVQGSLYDLQTKDQQGRPRDKPTIFFAVAVPKTDPGVAEVLSIINTTAWEHYKNIPHIAEQLKLGLGAVNFAWKVEDGDAVKNNGREGFAGCWVFRFSTSIYPVKTGDSNGNPIDPAMIKRGYYVDVVGNCAANELTDKNAGVYLNPNGVRLLGYGQEIQDGPTVGQMFANRPAALPAGASALPVAPANPGGAPAPIAGTPGAPPPLGGTPAAPQPPAGPGFAGGVTPPPPMMVAPPAPAQTAEQISAALAAQLGVQHYPGHRIRPDRSAYDPDPTTPPPPAPTAAAPAPMGLGGAVAGVSPLSNPTPPGLAGVPGVPAGASPGPSALGTVPPGSTTAYPSNVPPGVQPHPGILQPPAQPVQTQDDISAGIAAANGVQHHPGWRFDVATRQYAANPA